MPRRETFSAEASTPDGRVSATIHDVDQVEVVVDASWFGGASAAELESQLTRLARLLFVSRMREYFRARSSDFSEPVLNEAPPVSARDHDYVDKREQIVVEGGVGGPVHLACAGMQHWTVRIDPEWLARIDARGFAAAVETAAGELVRQQFVRIGELKREIWA